MTAGPRKHRHTRLLPEGQGNNGFVGRRRSWFRQARSVATRNSFHLRRGTAMVNPFDLKTVFLAKHAQHVVLIHFPIALFISAVAFDCIAQWRKNQALAAAAYFNLLLAAISTVPVVASGLVAWQWALEGQKIKGILLMHLILGCISSVLIWLVFWIHWRVRRLPERSLPKYRLPIEALAVLIVGLTGHLGGFLSGVNGTP